MCDPTGGVLTTVLTVASSALGAYSAIQSGRAQAEAEYYNAEIQRRNAQATEDEQQNVRDAAAIERRRLGEMVRAQRGELVAKFSAGGLDPNFGTPADLIGDVEQAGDVDRAILGRNEMTEIQRLDKEKADYTDAAKMSEASARSAWKGAKLQAVGSLLQGAADVSSRWIMPKPRQAPPSAGSGNGHLRVGA